MDNVARSDLTYVLKNVAVKNFVDEGIKVTMEIGIKNLLRVYIHLKVEEKNRLNYDIFLNKISFYLQVCKITT